MMCGHERVEFIRDLCLKDILPVLDPEMVLVITNGVEETVRMLPGDVSRSLRNKAVEFIKIDGSQLRIVVAR